jgi:hypothetical protein
LFLIYAHKVPQVLTHISKFDTHQKMEDLNPNIKIVPFVAEGAKVKNMWLLGHGTVLTFNPTTGVIYYEAVVDAAHMKTGDGVMYTSDALPVSFVEGKENYEITYNGNYKEGTYVDDDIPGPPTARQALVLIEKEKKHLVGITFL